MRGPEASQPLVVLTTVGDADRGRMLARTLVDSRLAACGTVLPGGTSIYRWDGAVTEATEALVVLKTTRGRWDALRDALVAAHPYDVPEVLALPVEAGHAPYLAWIADETTEESA